MDSTLGPESFDDTGDSLKQRIDAARRDILLEANQRRIVAEGLDSRAVGIAKEVYVIGDDEDIPFFSKRVHLEALRPFNQNPNARTDIEELYLYLPYDLDFHDGPGEDAQPRIIFLHVVRADDRIERFVLSPRKTSVFGKEGEMHVEMEHFESRPDTFDIDAVFPDGTEEIEDLAHLELLSEILDVLQDKNDYRITAQDRQRAA